MLNDIDPFQDLLELKQTCLLLAQKTETIMTNEKEFIRAINHASDRIDNLELRILQLETKLNETS